MTIEIRTSGRGFISAVPNLGAAEVSQCMNGRHEWAV